MRVLGIETSCDETGVAVYAGGRGMLAHAVYSQIEIHARYGGVVPELASRDHVRKTLPMIQQVLAESGLSPRDLDGVAYTVGPGLVGALLVGAALGRSLAWAWGVPAIGVHHMEGHLLAPLLEEPVPDFPFVALLVSGGHTQLVAVAGIGRYQLLGESLDDAVGEAFEPGRYRFPRPMTDRPGLNFSFSGLKTFALNTLHEELAVRTDPDQARADIARAFEEAVVETLIIKCRRAVRQVGYPRLVLAGGVSANRRLRAGMDSALAGEGARVYYPRPAFCTDNGAMIAFAGWQRLQAGQRDTLSFAPRARWDLASLPAV